MRDSRVLVTGGAGLVGSHLTDLLVKEGAAEVVVLDDFSRGTWANLAWALSNGNVRVIEGDVRDRAAVADAMRGVDYVFHQAAMRITACAERPRLAMEILVNGTYNILEAAQAHGVRKVVAASSASAYGLADVFPTPESQHPYNNRTIYGAAKVFNEGLLRSFNEMYGLSYVALRYFNVYGPRMDIYGAYTEVLIRWMERIAAGEPPLIFGDGLQTMDFVYVEDIARANVMAAQSDASDMVFNIASGEETSLRELASELCAVMGTDLEPEYMPERKVNSVSRRLADTTAAELYLGFRAGVGLRDGLRMLVSWWQEALVAV
jgi:UDP-glucose 4-epimerase